MKYVDITKIKRSSFQLDDIASGTHGAVPWRIDSEGTHTYAGAFSSNTSLGRLYKNEIKNRSGKNLRWPMQIPVHC